MKAAQQPVDNCSLLVPTSDTGSSGGHEQMPSDYLDAFVDPQRRPARCRLE
jgi:hypothetical protein